jgi:hypothetical protein
MGSPFFFTLFAQSAEVRLGSLVIVQGSGAPADERALSRAGPQRIVVARTGSLH